MELHELDNSLDTSLIFKPYKESKSILELNGFRVIKPFEVKSVYFEFIPNFLTAARFHNFNPYKTNTDKELLKIYNTFDKIVLKESRQNTTQWSTLNNYLDYRSGCFYKWFYPNGEPKI